MQDDRKIVGEIRDVEYRLSPEDTWHKGNAQLVSGAYENAPEKIAVFCYEEGEEMAHFAYQVKCHDEKGDELFININDITIIDNRIKVPRIRLGEKDDEATGDNDNAADDMRSDRR